MSTKAKNMSQTMSHIITKLFVKSVSGENLGQSHGRDLPEDLIDNELQVIYINRRTGERFWTQEEAERSRHVQKTKDP